MPTPFAFFALAAVLCVIWISCREGVRPSFPSLFHVVWMERVFPTQAEGVLRCQSRVVVPPRVEKVVIAIRSSGPDLSVCLLATSAQRLSFSKEIGMPKKRKRNQRSEVNQMSILLRPVPIFSQILASRNRGTSPEA